LDRRARGAGKRRDGGGALPRLLALLALACLAPLAANAGTADLAGEEWRVVIIRNWDSQFPINLIREKALREAMVHNAPRPVDIYVENVDPLRFFPEDTEREYVAYLQKKYRRRKIDVVVASGTEPLDFASRYRDTIWPGAAIVFNAVLDGTLDRSKLPARTTGVTMVFDIQGTLALGRAVAPSVRTLYVVAGTGPFDRMYVEYALAEIRRFDPSLRVNRIVGLSWAETLARVSAIEPGALVLYLTVLTDGMGQITVPGQDTVGQVAKHSPVPVLSAVWTQLRRGPLGGSSSSPEAHGRAAGLMARRILEGANPELMPVRADPAPQCEVDWNTMQRWNVREAAIPGNCRIAGRVEPLWRAYFWPIVLVAAIILLQSALIWSLVLQRRRRRIAEARARARGAEMAQVARLSTVGALTASIAHEINQPMGAILTNTDAAEMMLDQGTLDTGKLREILADIRSEDLRASEVIRGLRKMLAKREPEAVALDVNAEVADALRHLAFDAARRGVRLLPVFDGDTPTILGDSVQLQQALINLVMNAMEAVAGDAESAREVRIETHARHGGAEIVVSDRGPGIPREIAPQVFETMFTTRKEGMGFGLSIVRTIVEMHGGRVSYEPNVPRGAVFRIWLPAIGT
jgi:signal transduction histidine kinase